MFNPFVPFHVKMIDALRQMNRRYLVAQLNQNALDGFSEEAQVPILFSDYDDLGLAQIHLKALTDKYRSIIDLEKPEHRKKILEMIQPDSKYRVYASVIPDAKSVEKKLNDQYTVCIRSYISKMTDWKIGGGKSFSPKLELIFGELFVTLKHAGETKRLKLAELEKY
jgi:hypothetical protein